VRALALEPEEHLVEYDLVDELDAIELDDAVGETSRAGAGSLDELGKSAATERAQRCVDREATRAT
jgi:hypothetical protein